MATALTTNQYRTYRSVLARALATGDSLWVSLVVDAIFAEWDAADKTYPADRSRWDNARSAATTELTRNNAPW